MNATAFNRDRNAENRGINSAFSHKQVALVSGQTGTVLSLKGIPASMSRHRFYLRTSHDFATGDVAVGSVRFLLNGRIVLELPICGGIGEAQAKHSLSILQAPQSTATSPAGDSLFVGNASQAMRSVSPFYLTLLFDTVEVFLEQNSFTGSVSMHAAVFSEF